MLFYPEGKFKWIEHRFTVRLRKDENHEHHPWKEHNFPSPFPFLAAFPFQIHPVGHLYNFIIYFQNHALKNTQFHPEIGVWVRGQSPCVGHSFSHTTVRPRGSKVLKMSWLRAQLDLKETTEFELGPANLRTTIGGHSYSIEISLEVTSCTRKSLKALGEFLQTLRFVSYRLGHKVVEHSFKTPVMIKFDPPASTWTLQDLNRNHCSHPVFVLQYGTVVEYVDGH